MVVVEDAHWADEATLDLLRFLGRRLRDAHTLLVVTYRDEGLTATDPLLIALGDLSSQRGTRRIAVPPLTRSAVDELAAGGPITGEELYRLTGGNPFFVSEVLRGTPGEVPPSARDSVLARLAMLPAAAHRYAEGASLMGGRIEPGLLMEVVGEGEEGLDALVGSGMLVNDGPGLRFQHELARAAVEQELPAHRRTPLHARILDALVTSGCLDFARLAYHAEGAEDTEAVLRLAPEAGRSAAALSSHREAAQQFERALRFADAEPGPVRAHLYDALAVELALVDRWEVAAENAERARALWQETDDPVSLSGTELFLARVMWRLNRGADCMRLAQHARAHDRAPRRLPRRGEGECGPCPGAAQRRTPRGGPRAARRGHPAGRAAGPARRAQRRAQHRGVRPLGPREPGLVRRHAAQHRGRAQSRAAELGRARLRQHARHASRRAPLLRGDALVP